VITLLVCRVGLRGTLWSVSELKWLFVFLLGMYALMPFGAPSENDVLLDWHVSGLGWSIPINLSGLEVAGLMCLQILTVLLASAIVRRIGTGRDLVDGLRGLRLPPLFVHALDRTLELLASTRGRGEGRGRNRAPRAGLFALAKQLLRGDVSAFAETIRTNIVRAEGQPRTAVDRQLAQDAAVVAGIALCMASLKMLKILPGLPFASGYKTLLLFPLYVLAARSTHSRWGATAAGSIMGVIGFLQGDGRFGPLEIVKHIAPGLVIDLGEPLVRRLPPWALGYCALGFFAAIARTGTEFVVVLLLGARAEIYLFPAMKLVPNLMAGVLSGFVTMFVLRVLEGPGQRDVAPPMASARSPEARGGSAVAPNSEDHPGQLPPAGECRAGEPDSAAASPQPWKPDSGRGTGLGRGNGPERSGTAAEFSAFERNTDPAGPGARAEALAVGSPSSISVQPAIGNVRRRRRRTRRLRSLEGLALPKHASGEGSRLEGSVIRVRDVGYREPRLAKAALHVSDSWSRLWLRKQWPACSSPGQSLSISDWHAVRTGPGPCVGPPEPLLPCWP
jgi:hypothetical protein